MVYKPCHESDELHLYITNNNYMYHRYLYPVYDALDLKIEKGKYDPYKATFAFYHVATEGAKKYAKDFGSDNFTFSVTNRYTAALMLQSDFEEEKFGKTLVKFGLDKLQYSTF